MASLVAVPRRGARGLRRHAGLVVVLLAAAGLYLGQLPAQRLPFFYTDLVVAMSRSWRTWWFGGLDRLGTVTVDKQVGAFWPQALLVREFGLHPWALVLPQIVEGLVVVVVLYAAVTLGFGRWAGALAAAAFVLTPVATSVMGHSMEDGALTACLVVAAYLWQRSLRSGRWWPLVFAGVFVGLGFQAKMAQAWVLLPPLVLAEVLAGPARWPRRLVRSVVLVVVAVAVSLSWVLVALLDPTRPFVDGTRDGNPVTMVFGYNLLSRFGIQFPGALPFGGGSSGEATGGGLFGAAFYSQWGLLFPLAVAGAFVLLVRLVARRREPGARVALADVVLWSTWLALTLAAFGNGALAHTSYLVALAAPLAALVGAGLPALTRELRRRTPGWWLLPVALVATVVAAVVTQSAYPGFVPGLAVTVGVLGVVALLVLLAVCVRGRHPRALSAAVAAGVVVAAVVPAVWTLSVLTPHHDGSTNDASAGPGGIPRYARLADDDLPPLATQGEVSNRVVLLDAWLATRTPHARYLVMSNHWFALSPLLRGSDSEVLAVGGFSGVAPTLDLAGYEDLVRSGQTSWFLVADNDAHHKQYDHSDAAQIVAAVTSDCALTTPVERGVHLIPHGDELYRCSASSFPSGGGS